MKRANHALIAAIGFTVATFTPYFLRFFDRPIVAETDKWADFGTYIGGMLGPLFGLISIYLLVETLKTQKQQVEYAERSADEAKLAQQKQQRLAQRQSFEQSFFAWLHSYRDLVSSITLQRRYNTSPSSGYNQVLNGNGALVKLWEESLNLRNISSGTQDPDVLAAAEALVNKQRVEPTLERELVLYIIATARETIESHQFNITPLFNTLYQLIRWIDSSEELPKSEKHRYIAVLRAQVSPGELKYIFFYALKYNSLGKLVNKYGFLTDAIFEDALFSAVRRHLDGTTLTDLAFDADLAFERDTQTDLQNTAGV